jgi:hypothetical protein
MMPLDSQRSKVYNNIWIEHGYLLFIGWQYYVQEPKQVKFVKKAYGDNYKYSPEKLRMIKTK